MSQQPKSWQEKYLSSLKSYDGLYFYCEAQMPSSMRKSKLSDGYTPVGYPGRHIPVVPIANGDWRRARRLCDMLCWIFRVHVPHALEIAPVVASAKDLTAYGEPWYEWTQEIELDVTCACCGAIERVPHTDAEESGKWLCAECIDLKRWHEAYLEVAR
jgi:hypothetical protein